MLFNSLQFAIFFPLVTALYFVVPYRSRWVLLLAASCYFYMAFVPAYILILALSIGIDYVAGLVLEDAAPRWRKPALVISLIANIGLLAIFKYGPFLWESASWLWSGLGPAPRYLTELILPIGLSFHTFQAMSYTIEVYRGHQKAERHLGIYALYVMFYPQLVAGPIERPQNLLHQLRERHPFDLDRVRDGLSRIAWGLVKKVVLADRLAVAADALFEAPERAHGLGPVVGMICFAFQIFCDFSAYTDIALGAAKVMGITLMENFRQPYLSRSLPEFWSRWHISLSTWFKDYLYIPLGGNRVAAWRWYFNLFVVFLVSGLWHGANWTFIVWGALHGIGMIASVIGTKHSSQPTDDRASFYAVFQTARTFAIVCVCWVFFRASSIEQALHVLQRAAVGIREVGTALSHGVRPDFGIVALGVPWWQIALLIGAVLLPDVWQRYSPFGLRERLLRGPLVVRWFSYEVAFLLLVFLGRYEAKQFIYFQF